MTHNIVRRTLVSCSFAVALAVLLPTAHGQSCSVARAAGQYGFSDNGTVLGVGPRVAMGVFTLDAAGNLLNGKATSSLNGAVAEETFSGTYSVSSDCTGKIAVTIFDQSGAELLAVKLDIAFDDHMREMRAIFTSAVAPNGTSLATVIALEAKKVVP